MKKSYLLENSDIQRIRKMVRLIEKAVAEIIILKELRVPETDPFAPAQSDLIEESHFVEQQLDLLKYLEDHSF
jgi:hypothetical protein